MGYDDFAVYEFNKAIALNPKSGRSYIGRGFAYLEMCDFKAAPPDFSKPSTSITHCVVKWPHRNRSPTPSAMHCPSRTNADIQSRSAKRSLFRSQLRLLAAARVNNARPQTAPQVHPERIEKACQFHQMRLSLALPPPRPHTPSRIAPQNEHYFREHRNELRVDVQSPEPREGVFV